MRRPPRLPIVLLVLAGAALAIPPPPAGGDDGALAVDVAAVVAIPDPAPRSRAARTLAAREGLTVEALLPVLRGLSPAGAPAAGEQTLAVTSWDGTRVVQVNTAVVVPPGHDPSKPVPLLFAHHGAGGRGADMVRWWRGVAASLGAVLVCPDGIDAEGYAFEAREREALMGVLREVRRLVLVDDDRIWITGMSRGGHATWDLCTRHPGVFAAAAPMIGGPRLSNTKGENNLRYLENVVPLPIRDLQGSRDDPLLLDNLRDAFARLDRWKAPDAKLIEFPERGHDFDLTAVDWVAWLGAARRNPSPETVVRRAARPGEGRHLWIDLVETDRRVQETFTPEVEGSTWARMDAAARRDWMAAEVDRRTARAEARRTGPGTFTVRSTGVKRLRLLLDDATRPASGVVTVAWNGRSYRRTVRTDVAVLLLSFADSLDRSFLPVAEVLLP